MTNEELARLTQPLTPPQTYAGLTEDQASLLVKMLAGRGKRPVQPAPKPKRERGPRPPASLNMRKATRAERRILRQEMRKKLAENHEFWADHRGLCKQMAHKLIQEATK